MVDSVINGGFIDENKHPINDENQVWLNNVMYGTEPVPEDSKTTSTPEPRVEDVPRNNDAEYQRVQQQRRIAEMEEALRKSEQRINELGEQYSRSQPHPEPEPDPYALTEEEIARLGDAGVQRILDKKVKGLAAKQIAENNKRHEARIKELEKKIEESNRLNQQATLQSRISSVDATIAARVPEAQTLFANPMFSPFLEEQITTPDGRTTRRELMARAHELGNSEYIVGELNGFKKRIAPQQSPTNEAYAAQVRSSARTARGTPTLEHLGTQVKRTPNLERMNAEYERLSQIVISGNATAQDKINFNQLSDAFQKALRDASNNNQRGA